MYWLFSNEEAGPFVVEADDMEEAKEITEGLFPEVVCGESWCNPEPLTLFEVDIEGYDVY